MYFSTQFFQDYISLHSIGLSIWHNGNLKPLRETKTLSSTDLDWSKKMHQADFF